MATKSVGTLSAKLLLDVAGWIDGFSKAKSATSSFAGGIVGRFAAAAASVVSVDAAFRSLSQGMQQVDRQAKLADRLGITVGEVQKLSLAADLAGTDMETLARAMLKMGKNIGSGGMPLDKRLFQVADALAQIRDPGARGAKAEEVFGKGGMELLNVLMQGGQGIRNSANAIDRFGLAISRVDAAKIEAANDAITEMKTVIAGLRTEMAVFFSPAIVTVVHNFTEGFGVLNMTLQETSVRLRIITNALMGWSAAARGDVAGVIRASMNAEGLKGELADIQGQRAAGALGRFRGSGKGGVGGLFGPGGGGGSSPSQSGAAMLGSVAAASAIATAQGSSVDREQLKELQRIARNTDPRSSSFGLARL